MVVGERAKQAHLKRERKSGGRFGPRCSLPTLRVGFSCRPCLHTFPPPPHDCFKGTNDPIHVGSWGESNTRWGGGREVYRSRRRFVSPFPRSDLAGRSSYGKLSGSTLTFIDATDPNLLLVNFFLTASRSPPSWFNTREICRDHMWVFEYVWREGGRDG